MAYRDIFDKFGLVWEFLGSHEVGGPDMLISRVFVRTKEFVSIS